MANTLFDEGQEDTKNDAENYQHPERKRLAELPQIQDASRDSEQRYAKKDCEALVEKSEPINMDPVVGLRAAVIGQTPFYTKASQNFLVAGAMVVLAFLNRSAHEEERVQTGVLLYAGDVWLSVWLRSKG